MQDSDRFFRVFLDRIGNRNDARCLVVHCNEHGGFALGRQLFRFCGKFSKIDLAVRHELRIAQDHILLIQHEP